MTVRKRRKRQLFFPRTQRSSGGGNIKSEGHGMMTRSLKRSPRGSSAENMYLRSLRAPAGGGARSDVFTRTLKSGGGNGGGSRFE